MLGHNSFPFHPTSQPEVTAQCVPALQYFTTKPDALVGFSQNVTVNYCNANMFCLANSVACYNPEHGTGR